MATTLSPYLSFPGNTREVFAFYAQALDATVEAMLTYADMPRPPELEPAARASGCCVELPPPEAVMHGCLLLPGGARLMAGDAPPGMPFDGVKGVMLALQVDTVDQAERAFAALAEGGHITMPLAPSFWAKTFGMLTDRHGVSWAVSGEPA